MLYIGREIAFLYSDFHYYFLLDAYQPINETKVLLDGISISNLPASCSEELLIYLTNKFNSLNPKLHEIYSEENFHQLISKLVLFNKEPHFNFSSKSDTSINEIFKYLSTRIVCIDIELNKIAKILPYFNILHNDLMNGSNKYTQEMIVNAFLNQLLDAFEDLFIFSHFLQFGFSRDFVMYQLEEDFFCKYLEPVAIYEFIHSFLNKNHSFTSNFPSIELFDSYIDGFNYMRNALIRDNGLLNIINMISMNYKIGNYKYQINVVNLVSVFESLLCGDVQQNHLIDDSITVHFSRNLTLILEIINNYEHSISSPITKIYDINKYKKMLKEIYNLRSKIVHGSFLSTSKDADNLCEKDDNKIYFSRYSEAYDGLAKISSYLEDLLSRVIIFYIENPDILSVLKK